MNQKAVIFDMDGVIINSEALWKQAEKEIFTSLGVKVTDEWSKLTKSMTTTEVTKFWYNKFPWQNKNLELVEQLVISRVIELIECKDCLINGVEEFIGKLKKEDYKIGLATNSPFRVICTVLQKHGISNLFDTISSAEFENKGKPDPAIYLTTAKKLNVETNNCFVIEDSFSGMLAAKNAGMKVIAFTNGDANIDFEVADFKIVNFNNIDKIDLLTPTSFKINQN
jgi:HAD superfamily hydrolase (TIGR01509 family)